MLTVPDQEYPLVCIGVSRGANSLQPVHLEIINLNSNTSWFTSTGIENRTMERVQVNQLDCDTLLVQIENTVYMVNVDGTLKCSRKLQAEVHFSFEVESVVYVEDTLLALWKHGWQRRGEVFSEIMDEATDPRKIFRLIGTDRQVVLETRQTEDQTGLCNLYVMEIDEKFVLIS